MVYGNAKHIFFYTFEAQFVINNLVANQFVVTFGV
jgi:hypothetical protein